MRQNGNAARLECGSAEDGFLTGVCKDCKTDGTLRDALDRGTPGTMERPPWPEKIDAVSDGTNTSSVVFRP
jgi:hypothetical protein